jgi:hypothetical protein
VWTESTDSSDRIKQAANELSITVETHPQESCDDIPVSRLLPDTIILLGSPERLCELARKCGLAFRPTSVAFDLMNWVASVSDYVRGLEGKWLQQPSNPLWAQDGFNSRTLQWGAPAPENGQVGLYRRAIFGNNRYEYFLWKNHKRVDVDMRYGICAVLQQYAEQPTLFYCRRTHAMLVPYLARAPTLVSRALGLCSGHAPCLVGLMAPSGNDYLGTFPAMAEYLRSRMFLAYESVPEDVARLAAVKLARQMQIRG